MRLCGYTPRAYLLGASLRAMARTERKRKSIKAVFFYLFQCISNLMYAAKSNLLKKIVRYKNQVFISFNCVKYYQLWHKGRENHQASENSLGISGTSLFLDSPRRLSWGMYKSADTLSSDVDREVHAVWHIGQSRTAFCFAVAINLRRYYD